MEDSKRKSEIIEKITIKSEDNAAEYGSVVKAFIKAKDKIVRDIELSGANELVIRNMTELMAVRSIREKKNKEKTNKSQKILNKFKNLL